MKPRKQKGITLVALVVTIVVLLILAGVTINLVIGQNGLINRAREAAQKTKEKTSQELDEIEKAEAELAVISSDYDNKVNRPNLKTGMTPIYFEANNETGVYDTKTINSSDSNWYNYEEKHWANAQTQDGSMWVWIPRYAYKVNNDTKTFDVVFLIGTTDYYYNTDGKLCKAVRSTVDYKPDTTKEYTVHPAFANESSIGYVNGGWDSEMTGI